MPTKELTATKGEWIARLRRLNELVPSDWPDEVVSAATDNQIALEPVEQSVGRAEQAYLNKYAKRNEEGAIVTRETEADGRSTVDLGEDRGKERYVEMEDVEAFQKAQRQVVQETVTLEVRTVPPPTGYTLGQLRPIRWMLERKDVPMPNGAARAEA